MNADTWKNRHVFEQQLALNLRELEGEWPPHWHAWVELLRKVPNRGTLQYVLDIGCGCGARKIVLRRGVPTMRYVGCDYSAEAIDVANEAFGGPYFQRDFWEFMPNTRCWDVLSLCGLFDVLENGDAALEHALAWQHPCLLLGRMRLTDRASYVEQHPAYGIETYRFFHNRLGVYEKFEFHGYEWEEILDASGVYSFLLTRKAAT